jgi:hypothetical protein
MHLRAYVPGKKLREKQEGKSKEVEVEAYKIMYNS